MRTCKLNNPDLFKRLQTIEEELSHTRKTKEPVTFINLIYTEEISFIRQAKREHHPVTAHFSGKAFINLDDDLLFNALHEGIIDHLIEDTPLLKPFLQEYATLGSF
jgi:hypothetical protein